MVNKWTGRTLFIYSSKFIYRLLEQKLIYKEPSKIFIWKTNKKQTNIESKSYKSINFFPSKNAKKEENNV